MPLQHNCLLLLIVVLSGMSCQQSTHHKGDVIYSPDKRKFISFYNLYDENTQVMLNFERQFPKGGAGVFSIRADKVNIRIRWINNDSLSIEYPAGKSVSQQERLLKFFQDTVIVTYTEYIQ